MSTRAILFFLSLPLGLLSLSACGGSSAEPGRGGDRPQLAFVTNCVAEFWTVATHGESPFQAGAHPISGLDDQLARGGQINRQIKQARQVCW